MYNSFEKKIKPGYLFMFISCTLHLVCCPVPEFVFKTIPSIYPPKRFFFLSYRHLKTCNEIWLLHN